MPWAVKPDNRPIVKKTDPITGFRPGDLVTIQQGDPGVPIGLLLILTTEPVYTPGVVTKYGFKGVTNG